MQNIGVRLVERLKHIMEKIAVESSENSTEEGDYKKRNSKVKRVNSNGKPNSKGKHCTSKNFFAPFQKLLSKYQIAIPRWLYSVFFVINSIAIAIILQAGVQTGTRSQVFSKLSENLNHMVTGMWERLNFIFVLNVLIIAAIYGLLLIITNSFWLTSMALFSVAIIISMIEYIKIFVRNEAILPADLNFLQSDTGNISTFLPPNANRIILYVISSIIFFIIVFTAIHLFDKNRGSVVWFGRKSLRYGVRAGVFVVILGLLSCYIASAGTVGSVANSFNKAMGDRPAMWDSSYDALSNGPLVAFMRQVNPKVMSKPYNYSESTMKEVLHRYEKVAKKINSSRKNSISDSTLIMVLSESFANPERIPGISFNKSVAPFIEGIKKTTDSGLMLSSGYGGGTANLEYMAISGLSMANFDPSLTSPYQQLVPKLSWMPTFNRYWNDGKNSVAFHPYEPSMYLRGKNYKKFGFTKFYTLRQPYVIKYQNHIDLAPYVSDESSYDSVLDSIEHKKSADFIQLVTMQNHMPYNNWYKDNEFKVSATKNANPLGTEETSIIQTYAKGANYTDEATEKFLNKLDQLHKPVTVLFYGDHLPGAYSTASADKNNSLILHLTDYFIWSNKAAKLNIKSSKHNSHKTNAYTSPNFFIPQVANHMNAKVSPYAAFLTKLHNRISAIEPPVVNKIQVWDRIPEGQPIYLDHDGKPMAYSNMDNETKQLLDDYKLIQYDITAGKCYMRNTDFFKMP